MWESKAVSCGREIKLRDEQMARYAVLQKSRAFKFPEIYFNIFRHGIKKLEKDILIRVWIN